MKSRRRSSQSDSVLAQPENWKDVERLAAVRQSLKQHLVHTRELLNGRDFLFLGPREEIQELLKTLVKLEHGRRSSLQFDYAQVESVLLLRITGLPGDSSVIQSYFD